MLAGSSKFIDSGRWPGFFSGGLRLMVVLVLGGVIVGSAVGEVGMRSCKVG